MNGRELWATDGTVAGTQMVKDIFTGATGSDPVYLKVYKKFLYFIAQQAANDQQLFKTDGTSAGTVLVSPAVAPNVNPLVSTSEFIMYDSTLFFAANYNGNGNELWSMKDTTTYPPPGNVFNLDRDNIFSIVPNPNDGHFNLLINDFSFKEGTVQVMDMTGKLLYEAEFNDQSGNKEVALPPINAGLYMVRVGLDEQYHSAKLIVR